MKISPQKFSNKITIRHVNGVLYQSDLKLHLQILQRWDEDIAKADDLKTALREELGYGGTWNEHSHAEYVLVAWVLYKFFY